MAGGANNPMPPLTQPVAALISHIQAASEQQKAALARELHDELGGMLVGAVMDIAWAEQHLSVPTAELRQKLIRARQTLASAIDLKRRLIEDLRPTLLDNVGLYAALRWHVQSTCEKFDLQCRTSLPETELRFSPKVAIALFRIVQEALAVALTHKRVASTDFTVSADPQVLTIKVVCEAAPGLPGARVAGASNALTALRYRIAALGGELQCTSQSAGGTSFTATFPLVHALVEQ